MGTTKTTIVQSNKKKTEVNAGQKVKFQDSSATIQLPENLPDNLTIIVQEVEKDGSEKFEVDGTVIDVTLDALEGYEGERTLTLSIHEDYSDKDVSIYYYNVDSVEWEKQESKKNKDKSTISTTVSHFSKYGVFLDIDSEDQNDEDGQNGADRQGSNHSVDEDNIITASSSTGSSNGGALPKTATSTPLILLIGILMVVSGASLIYIRQRKALN